MYPPTNCMATAPLLTAPHFSVILDLQQTKTKKKKPLQKSIQSHLPNLHTHKPQPQTPTPSNHTTIRPPSPNRRPQPPPRIHHPSHHPLLLPLPPHLPPTTPPPARPHLRLHAPDRIIKQPPRVPPAQGLDIQHHVARLQAAHALRHGFCEVVVGDSHEGDAEAAVGVGGVEGVGGGLSRWKWRAMFWLLGVERVVVLGRNNNDNCGDC